jgi:hypothetical protein
MATVKQIAATPTKCQRQHRPIARLFLRTVEAGEPMSVRISTGRFFLHPIPRIGNLQV